MGKGKKKRKVVARVAPLQTIPETDLGHGRVMFEFSVMQYLLRCIKSSLLANDISIEPTDEKSFIVVIANGFFIEFIHDGEGDRIIYKLEWLADAKTGESKSVSTEDIDFFHNAFKDVLVARMRFLFGNVIKFIESIAELIIAGFSSMNRNWLNYTAIVCTKQGDLVELNVDENGYILLDQALLQQCSTFIVRWTVNKHNIILSLYQPSVAYLYDGYIHRAIPMDSVKIYSELHRVFKFPATKLIEKWKANPLPEFVRKETNVV